MTIFMWIVLSKSREVGAPAMMPFLPFLLLMAKGWGGFVGIFALIGVGLAAWFEDGIYRRQAQAVDPRAAAEVFR